MIRKHSGTGPPAGPVTADAPPDAAAPAPVRRDPLSRAAIRQMIWLGTAGTGIFVALMMALSWASSLTSGGITSTGAVDYAANSISIVIAQEPPQLDSTRATDTTSGMILGHVMEGLLRYDVNNRLAPGVAERWELRRDGATFWLREDARWSDGKPVTAHDFEFAWQTAVDPRTASRYAFIFYVLKNAAAINRGELPREDLGVEAVSDRVLEVTYEQPVSYFDKLVAFPTFYPVRGDFHRARGGNYGANAEDLLYNGPFRIESWVHGASLRLVKNEQYWRRDEIRLDAINVPFITPDSNTRINLFRDGQVVAVDHLGSEVLDQVLEARWPLGRYSDGSVWFFQLNHRPFRQTSNWHLRKALQLVNDPAELVYKVIKIPSYIPGESLFPVWLKGVNGFFRQEYPAPTVTPNVDEARRHLEIAKQELGVDEIGPLVLLTDDTPTAGKQAEYYQDLFMRTLGIEIRIDKQIFKQRLAKVEDGDFDIAMYGWGPDYDDPMTFADLFASWNLNNHGAYKSDELDHWVHVAQQSLDPRTRMDAFGRIQQILFDDVVIIMNYERGVLYVQDPRIAGVARRSVGPDPDYTNAYLVETP